ncbi:MAG: glycogen synthase GlgA [Ignavibacteriaceae bacterium]|jgi:starch synthase|nr:glycogen synthase GlgA [Chlorobium sp.]MCW8818665.1 glycogen synthase GlgA [Ignavibacteriaceae bacterium]MCW8822835.1 glycogen synthase GlgA [Ignavibacteriaceae bacterium]MCW8995389.1 glycogen synthase GlgA [Psychromonas sp.]MCW9095831.1 glycogen synthase GlgA [Ignavibacteriaceae bacterium]
MKIAFVSTEIVPFAKTGGLADVSGSLPRELVKLGCNIKLFMPKYFLIDENLHGLKYSWDIGEMPIRINGIIRSVHVHQSKLPDSDIDVYFIDCPHYFHRYRIYTDDFDEDERFILFSKAVIETLQRLQWIPDVVHCNDWQPGLIPLLLKDNYGWDKAFDKTGTLLSIHNIGYQGRFSKSVLNSTEIRSDLFYPDGPVEQDGGVSFMKAGISFSDIINTVSNTYAHEILTAEFGAGLEKVLKQREEDLFGILNGVDYDVWSPETDKHLPFNYSIDDLSGKLKNKKFLLEHFDISFNKDIPLIGIVSRMVLQKGFDIFADAINDLMNLEANWIILGSGEDKFEDLFRRLSNQLPGEVGSYIGYNNELSHLIEAGADMFLMPSRYEPCGLNQIYSLKYGTVPIVRKTGGLADTIKDWDEENYYGFDHGNGFSFYDYTGYALYKTVERAVNTFKHKEVWKKIQTNGMNLDFSWERSAEKYLELYRLAKEKRV